MMEKTMAEAVSGAAAYVDATGIAKDIVMIAEIAIIFACNRYRNPLS
jgi:hypothetical protein